MQDQKKPQALSALTSDLFLQSSLAVLTLQTTLSSERLMMSLPLVFLLMVVGASGAEWSMNYTQQGICALNGSTVFMNGTFTHPERLTVNKSFWVIDPVKDVDPPDLSTVSSFSGRVEYLVDKNNNSALKLSNVMKEDNHEFCFRVLTDVEGQKWMRTPGIKLRVTELHVESPGEVTEGESAVLTCKTTCSLTDPTFIWYKDGRPLTTEMIQKNQQLHLQTVSSEDAGSYSCAVRGSEHLPSTAQTLRVRHPPKNVSVSISPSGGIVEGSSVNMTCSSDGDPPVENYTWFKGSSSVGTGGTYSIPNISSEDSGEYTCQSRNELGERRSSAVSLNVLYPPRNVSVSFSSSDEMVNLTCSGDANPPVENYTWFKDGGDSPVGSGQSFSIINITADHTGLYYCEAQNAVGVQNGSVMIGVQKGQIRSAVWITVGGGGGFLLLLLFILILIFISRMKKRDAGSDQDGSDQVKYPAEHNPSYFSDVSIQSSVNKMFSIFIMNDLLQDDIQYATVTHSRSRPVETAGDASSGAPDHDDDVQYATVRTGRKPDVVIRSDQQEELQYASVTFHHRHADAAATGSQKVDDASVIYDRVK